MTEALSNFWFGVTALAQSPLLQVMVAVPVMVWVSVWSIKAFRAVTR